MNDNQLQFTDIVVLIQKSRVEAIKAVNSELINLYWNVGSFIKNKLTNAQWGEKTVDELAQFIALNHPDIKGFNRRSLYRMKQFYETYANSSIIYSTISKTQNTDNELNKIVSLPRTQFQIEDIRKTNLAKISWTHHRTIFSRCSTNEEREFYLKLSIKENYTVKELDRQISASLFERTMLSSSNMPPVLSKIAPSIEQHFRDNYVFEFLNLPEPYSENDLQKGLIRQMKNFVLELGKDFLFVGEEYRLQVGNKDFYSDLLFYHRELQCLVAFELKTEAFEPEHLGKLNFYLEALDRDVKKQHENPSIGILLCKDKDHEVVEYALSRNMSPTLISQYKLALPEKKLLQAKLHELFELATEKKIE